MKSPTCGIRLKSVLIFKDVIVIVTKLTICLITKVRSPTENRRKVKRTINAWIGIEFSRLPSVKIVILGMVELRWIVNVEVQVQAVAQLAVCRESRRKSGSESIIWKNILNKK